MTQVDLSFPCMGSTFRVLVAGGVDAENAAVAARTLLEGMDESLSLFKPDSELSLLNNDPRPVVPASTRLRDAVRAALWGAERSDGLSDPTTTDAVIPVATSRARIDSPLEEVLAAAPPRRPARPDPAARWKSVVVDDRRGAIRRQHHVKLDLGGSAKGFAADRVAAFLAGRTRFAVDCAGDIRVGGPAAFVHPFEVVVEHPFDDRPAARLHLTGGAVATSGLFRHVWIADGAAFNHLVDPSTGTSAWTGLVQASAVAPTGLEAEALAKTAYLVGPLAARRVLAEHGGVLVDEAGRVEIVPGRGEAPLVARIQWAA
ncbi:MAG: FAD:protein transferase [Gaiellaceae bacterium]|nr:FAD:protein transferase [Gaiellaceae bacterium]